MTTAVREEVWLKVLTGVARPAEPMPAEVVTGEAVQAKRGTAEAATAEAVTAEAVTGIHQCVVGDETLFAGCHEYPSTSLWPHTHAEALMLAPLTSELLLAGGSAAETCRPPIHIANTCGRYIENITGAYTNVDAGVPTVADGRRDSRVERLAE